jgi:hypothetical protein
MPRLAQKIFIRIDRMSITTPVITNRSAAIETVPFDSHKSK